MLKSIISMAAAALIAGLMVFLTSVAPEVNAAEVKRALPQPFAMADRLPILVKGAACSQRSWPHYEQSCLFDKRVSADKVRKVRVINFDRREMQARAPTLEILALR